MNEDAWRNRYDEWLTTNPAEEVEDTDIAQCPVCKGTGGPQFCRPCNGRGVMDASDAEDWQDHLDECARDAEYYEQQDEDA